VLFLAYLLGAFTLTIIPSVFSYFLGFGYKGFWRCRLLWTRALATLDFPRKLKVVGNISLPLIFPDNGSRWKSMPSFQKNGQGMKMATSCHGRTAS